MANKKIVLCDTGVFFDYFQNDAKIMAELDNIGFENLSISPSVRALTSQKLSSLYGHEPRKKYKIAPQRQKANLNTFTLQHIFYSHRKLFTGFALLAPNA